MAGLFLVKDFQLFNGESFNPILNVYGYRSNVAVVDELNELLNAFAAQMLPKIVNIQSQYMVHDRLEAYELNTVNFVTHTLTSGNVGQRGGFQDCKFTSWGFRLNRATLGTRSGQKRIGVISDADVASGGPVAGIVSDLNAYAAEYGAPLKVGIIDTWFPVILHRPHGGVTAWTDSGSNGASFVNVTTQNTRKK